jgi:hypothetical protein
VEDGPFDKFHGVQLGLRHPPRYFPAKPMATLTWNRVQEHWNDPSIPEGYTYRAKVPGGWLVSTWAGDPIKQQYGGGVTFLPDKDYAWEKEVPDFKAGRRDTSANG